MNGVMVMTQESVFPASGILEAENQPETRSARRILPPDQLTRIHIAFDSRRPAANLKLFLPVTLSHHLGLGGLVNRHVDPGDAPGWAHAGGKLLTLVASALAGGLPEADIDNADCPHVSHLSLSSAGSSRMMPGILPKSASAVTMRVTPKMDWCPLQWYPLDASPRPGVLLDRREGMPGVFTTIGSTRPIIRRREPCPNASPAAPNWSRPFARPTPST